MKISSPRQTNITNAEISPSAGIEYSKLDLSGKITNNDIATNAAISYSKLENSRLPLSRIPSGAVNYILIGNGEGSDPYYGYHSGLAVLGNCYSTNIVHNNSTERSTVTYPMVKLKETIVDEDCISMYVSFDMRTTSSTVHGRIYINDNASGTLWSTNSTTYVTFSNYLYDIKANDKIQLYGEILGGGTLYVQNLKIGLVFGVGKFGSLYVTTPIQLDESLTIGFTDNDPT